MSTLKEMDNTAQKLSFCPHCGHAGVALLNPEGAVIGLRCPDCDTAWVAEGERPPIEEVAAKAEQLKASPRISALPDTASEGGSIRRGVNLGANLKPPSKKVSPEQDSFKPKVRSIEQVKEEGFVVGGKVTAGRSEVKRRKKRMSKEAMAKIEAQKRVQRNRRILVVGGWCLLWLILAGAGVYAVFKLRPDSETSKGGLAFVRNLSPEEKVFYEKEHSKVQARVDGFLATGELTERSGYLLPVSELQRKLVRHYSQNKQQLEKVAEANQEMTFWNVSFEENPGFVEVVWQTNGVANFREAVLYSYDGQWFLDWEHYVRYSDFDWELFRRNLCDEKEGDFRLYVELTSEGLDKEGVPQIEVLLLPPLNSSAARRKAASDVLTYSQDDPLFRQLNELFVSRESWSDGYSELWKRDSGNLRRATLRLRHREETDEQGVTRSELEIVEVLAENWRTLDSARFGVKDEDK